MSRNIHITRINVIFAGIFVVSALIILRLFSLQVISHGYYEEIAQREQQGYTTLPARRGEILIEDYHSGESYKLGTNTTLNMIYADPTLIDNPEHVAETLAPFLFDLEVERELDELRYEEEYEIVMAIENEDLQEEAFEKLALKTDEELAEEYREKLTDILAQKTRDVILIAEDLDSETMEELSDLNLQGTELTENGNLYAYPAQISDKDSVAETLAEVFNTEAADLESILLGKNRYVVLDRKLDPEISVQIETILESDILLEEPLFLGIRMQEEYFRFYPEQSLAAQILGYVNSAGDGQYGIEGSFDEFLKGKDGMFTSQIDAYGNQITVGESIIEQAEDGADITLTIDRAIQLQVERYLAEGVTSYRADSGQVIVADPSTGAILAMAQYPSFNPNTYGDVFDLTEIEISDEDMENKVFLSGDEENPIYWYYKQIDPDVRIQIFPDPEDEDKWWAYENEVGPEVYKNKTIQEVYEPGSIFKPIVMSAALDANEVTPNTTHVCSGPLGVDMNSITGEYDFYIKTFNNEYHGIETMTQVLQHSCNIGMAFVANKLGPALLYSYFKSFGLLKRTDIEISDEVVGNVEHYDNWTESEMVTKAFGQGISMTPIQLLQAYTALPNQGTMMKPYLVKKITYADGSVEEFEPEIIGQVIEEEASQQITAMMTATAESYIGLYLKDHYFAGKSGTAQTYKWGKALSGPGTTIASFVGYGPIEEPQFLVLVKLDHPRSSEWGAETSGKIFKNIITYLYDYYNIPPDKN
jgi:stage V sporulation protein D (sporulation-specific penicillin-binding protein)